MSLSLKVYSCIQLNHIILSPPPLKTKTVLWGFLLAWEQEFSWFFSKEIALNAAVDSVCPGDEVSSESYANILDWTPETQRDIFFIKIQTLQYWITIQLSKMVTQKFPDFTTSCGHNESAVTKRATPSEKNLETN